jgi:dipeptidyl aminopeptidase/acylaminoacyl peptidase
MSRRWRWVAIIGLVAAVGCSESSTEGEPEPAPTSEPTDATTSPTTPTPSPSAPSTTPAPPVRHPVSLPALMAKEYDGRGLRLRGEQLRTASYTRYDVTYRSGDLRISGILNLPHGRGPFPALVLNHGYIDPDVYVTGQGLAREQDYLAREGFIVLHTDYRDHAESDPAPGAERRLRLGYTEDVINAVLALRRSRLPVDDDRIGLLGRSMGGGVTYNALVVRPGLVDAAVVFAPVSSNTVDNFDRWIRGERTGLAGRIIAAYGSPERRPEFWRGVSPYTYFDRVTEPLLVHHGTVDDTCPPRWTQRTVDELRRLGKNVRLRTYPGEGHTFYGDWPLSMRRTVAFFDRHLG